MSCKIGSMVQLCIMSQLTGRNNLCGLSRPRLHLYTETNKTNSFVMFSRADVLM
jgi:hypothetical protein